MTNKINLKRIIGAMLLTTILSAGVTVFLSFKKSVEEVHAYIIYIGTSSCTADFPGSYCSEYEVETVTDSGITKTYFAKHFNIKTGSDEYKRINKLLSDAVEDMAVRTVVIEDGEYIIDVQ